LRDEHDVRLFNLTAGSPYYNPHVQRPAFYPPSDGYQPPEDPLAGCVRQIDVVRQVKVAVGDVVLVGTAYSYFQEYLPHVAEAVVKAGWVDSVGIGRLVLSDWTLPDKVLRGEDYAADKKICRTFSDCTTAPRNGMISGCYPLDDYYKDRPEFETLKKLKAGK
jgi:NADPH2 dehydrogenase